MGAVLDRDGAQEARRIMERLRGQPPGKVEKFVTVLYGSASLNGQAKAITHLPAQDPGAIGHLVIGVNGKGADQGPGRD
jgi:hypothetical protein